MRKIIFTTFMMLGIAPVLPAYAQSCQAEGPAIKITMVRAPQISQSLVGQTGNRIGKLDACVNGQIYTRRQVVFEDIKEDVPRVSCGTQMAGSPLNTGAAKGNGC